MKRNILLLAFFTAILSSAWAQGPNNSGTYYQAANGKTGATLKSALGEIIMSPGTYINIGYNGLWKAYEKTDKRNDGTKDYVRDWYSNNTKYGFSDHGTYSKEGDSYNREHTVCQSWFEGSSEAGKIKCDVVHVVPTDGYVNGKRSNFPFGEVVDPEKDTYSKKYQSANKYSMLGTCRTEGYNGIVFEPNDEIKGDIARIYFYMVTRYASDSQGWGNNVFVGGYEGFKPWVYNMLLRWAKQDPVSEEETARNNAVYEVQKNRNPFVDYPGLEDYIWGDKINVPFSYDNYNGEGPFPQITAMPVFSPNAGTYYNSVEVTLTCATEGATIYYTTGGADASEQSIEYTEPFTLTETTTIKAVAVKDGEVSAQAEATYIITDQQIGPVNGEIALNNDLFGTNYSGTINKTDNQDLIGTQNGVTIVYALGSGSYRYCNNSQIRVYPGNTLTISVTQGTIAALQYVFAQGTGSKDLLVDGVAIQDGKWTGNAQSVTTTYPGTKGNVQLTAIRVTMTPEEPLLAAPTISPDGGTYQESLEVTLECDNEEAEIYYTLDDTDPTEEEGILYEGPFTLTETTTVKAIAVMEDYVSPISEATFTITDEPIDPFIPAEGEIALTNQFFGTDYHGTTYDKADFVGTLNNVVVTYAKGEGHSRYVTDNQIRLYTGNTLNISSTQGIITEIRFIMADDTPSRDLVSDDGTPIVDDVWTGSSKSGITKSVTVAMGTGTHIRLVGLKVITSVNTGVDMAQRNRLDGRRVIYNLRGQRVTTPRRGLYIVDGKKLFIE